MNTITQASECQVRIKDSKFIGIARPVDTESNAKKFLDGLKVTYRDASHVCYGYSIGTGQNRVVRASDAGEPANTAGQPILSAITSRDLTNVIVAVVRYFGGTKLGIGGLIRAYGGCASEVLNRVNIVPFVPVTTLKFRTGFQEIGGVMSALNECHLKAEEEYFQDGIVYSVRVKDRDRQHVIERLMNATAGNVQIETSAGFRPSFEKKSTKRE